MTDTESGDRLSRIATRWSLILDAHGGSEVSAGQARRDLLNQYSGAVYRYLRGAVRDAEIAEGLLHEFAVRLLEGDFHRASPDRGRFRDYVKTCLINLVNDYFALRRRFAQERSLNERIVAAPPESLDAEQTFEHCLRDELLNQAWQRLQEDNAVFHEVLLTRAENPEISSRELADRLSRDKGKHWTAGAIRKTLERARSRLADILVEAVREMLGCLSDEQLRKDLRDLGLLSYCRAALERRSLGGHP